MCGQSRTHLYKIKGRRPQYITYLVPGKTSPSHLHGCQGATPSSPLLALQGCLLGCRSGRKRSRSPDEEGEVSEAEEQTMPVDFHGIVNQAVCVLLLYKGPPSSSACRSKPMHHYMHQMPKQAVCVLHTLKCITLQSSSACSSPCMYHTMHQMPNHLLKVVFSL